MRKVHLAGRDLALILVVVALWGFSFVPIKWGLREVPPFALAALRFFFAAVPLVFFVRRPRIPAKLVIAYGLAIGLGIAFLGDRLQRENVVGAAVAALGVVLLAVYKIQSGAAATFAGMLLVLVAAFAWAVGNIVAKRAAGDHSADMFALVVWSSLAPPVPLLIASYLFEGGPAMVHAVATASWITWACVLFLAYAATLFGFASWARMLHRYPTALVAPFGLLIPVSGLASGALFLGESLAPLQAVGVGLVFVGLVVNLYGGRLRARAAQPSPR